MINVIKEFQKWVSKISFISGFWAFLGTILISTAHKLNNDYLPIVFVFVGWWCILWAIGYEIRKYNTNN